MSTEKMLFGCAVALLAIVLLCFAVMYIEKKFPGVDYDERQKQIRGNGFRLGFAVGIVWQMVLLVLIDLGKELPLDLSTLVFIGVVVQILVHHVYCLLNHAALPLSQNMGLTIGGYLLTGFMHLISFRNNMELYQKIGAQLGYTEPWAGIWMKLLLALSFFVLAVLHLIALLREKRE